MTALIDLAARCTDHPMGGLWILGVVLEADPTSERARAVARDLLADAAPEQADAELDGPTLQAWSGLTAESLYSALPQDDATAEALLEHPDPRFGPALAQILLHGSDRMRRQVLRHAETYAGEPMLQIAMSQLLQTGAFQALEPEFGWALEALNLRSPRPPADDGEENDGARLAVGMLVGVLALVLVTLFFAGDLSNWLKGTWLIEQWENQAAEPVKDPASRGM